MSSTIEHTIGTWHARDHGGAHIEVWNDNDPYGELHSSINVWDHKLGKRDPEHPQDLEHLHDLLAAYIDGAEMPRVPVATNSTSWPTNSDRAWRAWSTVCDYARRTGQITDQRYITDPASDQGQAVLLEWVGDLTADLLHLAEQHGIDADDVIERARMHHAAEVAEEAQDDDPEWSEWEREKSMREQLGDEADSNHGRFVTRDIQVRIIFGADTMPPDDNVLVRLVQDQLSGELGDDGLFCCDVIHNTSNN